MRRNKDEADLKFNVDDNYSPKSIKILLYKLMTKLRSVIRIAILIIKRCTLNSNMNISYDLFIVR